PAHLHHPSIERRAAHLNARFTLQNRGLAVQRQMIAVFLHYGVDHYSITGNAFFDDARFERSHHHSAFAATAAGALFTERETYEILCRLHIEHFTFVVADDFGLRATSATQAGLATHDVLDALQIFRQPRTARMLRTAFAQRSVLDRLALRFG